MTAANPYPGLRSFEPGESELFFGREHETDELRRRLRLARFLAVVGGSGSGKSSLVRSGLIPSLHAGFMSGAGTRWRIAIMRPGEDPIGRLADALNDDTVLGPAADHADTRRTVFEAGLRDSSLGLAETVRQASLPEGENLLLVVDQFEELFRYRRRARSAAHPHHPTNGAAHSPANGTAQGAAAGGASGASPGLVDRAAPGDDAAAFVRLLIESVRGRTAPVYVVLTMRAEFIGDCMAFAGLPEAINVGQYLIPRMSRDAMRDAITGPAAVCGATLAPRLVVRLLNELSDDFDRLPVLQHALMRTWDAWACDHVDDEPLDLRHYEAIGTTRNALSQHADEAWADLKDARGRAIAERLWKTVTETTEDGRGLRRPTPFGTLCRVCGATAAEVSAVIDVFRAPGRSFLQPPPGEALRDDTVIDLSHEALMRQWMRLAEWVRQEARAADIYRRLLRAARAHKAKEAGLWRPPELTLGRRWQQGAQRNAAWAGGDAHDYALAMAFLARSRWMHLARVVALVVTVLVLVGAGFGWLAREAQQQARLAAAQRQLVEAREREISALRLNVEQLTQANQRATAARAQDQERVQALRGANATLKVGVAALEVARGRAEEVVSALREGNRRLEVALDRTTLEVAGLKERSALAYQAFDQLDTEAGRLADGIQLLQSVPPVLSTQADALRLRLDEARHRRDMLRDIERQTEPCEVPRAAAMAPSTAARPVLRRAFRDGDAPRNVVVIPPAPALADDLRRRIEELARELAALMDERARLSDEIAFLDKANALLDAQQSLLQQALARLEVVRVQLVARQRALQQAVAEAEAERVDLLQNLAQLESARASLQARVDTLRRDHAVLEQATSHEADKVGTLEKAVRSTLDDNQRLTGRLEPIVTGLARAATARDTPADLGAMLAVKAWRWAVRDADDAAHPQVYNALWLALRRVDPAGASALTAPADAADGKIGITRSSAIAQALCQRAGRPFTEAEWQRHLPAGACFTPETARACGP